MEVGQSRFVRYPEMAELLGVKTPTLYRWIKDGVIPAPAARGPRLRSWDRAFAQQIADAMAKGRPLPTQAP